MSLDGYVCNPTLKTVTPVTFKKSTLLKEMYAEIGNGCELVQWLPITDNSLSGYIDEEGALKPNVKWTFGEYEVHGNAILLGKITASGAESSCKLSREKVIALCEF